MEEWIKDNLSKLLDFDVPSDLTKYIMQMDEGDLDEYLKTLLNYKDSRHKLFIENLKKWKCKGKQSNEEHSIQKKPNERRGIPQTPQEPVEITKANNDKGKVTAKKKTKFVNLYSDEGEHREILLKGRHKCDCEAKEHGLINNCLNCGRIVCKQEGAGPCFYCGELVCSPDQQQILALNTKQSDTLYNKLMKPNKNIEESLKRRDKLLEYDRNSAQRTKIIDDESDYFQASTNTWLSKEEREMMKKKDEDMMAKKHQNRLNRKVTLDFAGGLIYDEEDNFGIVKEDLETAMRLSQEREFMFPEAELLHRPIYMPVDSMDYNNKNQMHPSLLKHRIQDKEYLEMSDDGMCLSLHQPYASLLVAGIKEHEGRTWYTHHRGRLWIASAAKTPSPDEIKTMENHYRVLKSENIKFPQHYPVGCLLGCVTIVDVLTQEEYQQKFPEGDSESPYVFICEDPYELSIRFPIQGKHKIYKLDDKIHRAAVNSLQTLMQKKS